MEIPSAPERNLIENGQQWHDRENKSVPEPGDPTAYQVIASARNVLIVSDDSEQDEEELNNESISLLRGSPPKDNFNLVYMVFYLLGMGTLLPWNFFISVNSFWDYKFRDVNTTGEIVLIRKEDEEKTELQKEFTSYLAIASNGPNAVWVILNAVFGQRFRLEYRIYTSLGVIVGLFFVILALSRANSDDWQHEFLVFVLVLVVLVNCCTAVFQGGVFGAAGKFPVRYMGAVMAGQAMGGIFPAVVDIVTVALKVPDKDEGFYCFLIATVVLIASFLAFSWVQTVKFFKYFSNDHGASSSSVNTSQSENSSVISVVRRNWQYCLSVYLTFTVTLAIFPAVTVLVEPENPDRSSAWSQHYFTPVTSFLLFNCGDYAGRILSDYIVRPRGSRRGSNLPVLCLAVCRIVFVPLFMFCNAAPLQRTLPIWFHSDAVYITFMVAFSVSNGYLGNLCMLLGPKVFESGHDQELAAMILAACLVVGTGSGSLLSYPLISVI